jgi:hypothetical protein
VIGSQIEETNHFNRPTDARQRVSVGSRVYPPAGLLPSNRRALEVGLRGRIDRQRRAEKSRSVSIRVVQVSGLYGPTGAAIVGEPTTPSAARPRASAAGRSPL